MTSNFTAAELRELADRLETRSFDYQPNPFCLHCAAALREYAQLIDTVLDGGDVVTDDLVQHVRNHACAIPKHGVYKVEDFIVGDVDSVVYAALTAALPAIRLRLLADTAKEGTK